MNMRAAIGARAWLTRSLATRASVTVVRFAVASFAVASFAVSSLAVVCCLGLLLSPSDCIVANDALAVIGRANIELDAP